MPRARLITDQTGTAYAVDFDCPGCSTATEIESHTVPVKPYALNGWTWNTSLDKPTLEPSVLVHEMNSTDGKIKSPRCHSYVRDGRIEFLSDCGHALAGQNVDLPEVAP